MQVSLKFNHVFSECNGFTGIIKMNNHVHMGEIAKQVWIIEWVIDKSNELSYTSNYYSFLIEMYRQTKPLVKNVQDSN